MGSKNEMTRKEFLTLTFTLIGTTAAVACSDNNNSTGTAGTSGGTAGHGGSGGSAGTTGSGGAGGTSAAACADPLPAPQTADGTGHMHMVTIQASTLNATTAQTFTTNVIGMHMHDVTLQPADLTTLKGGGSVMITSSSAGTPAHTHVYTVSCH